LLGKGRSSKKSSRFDAPIATISMTKNMTSAPTAEARENLDKKITPRAIVGISK